MHEPVALVELRWGLLTVKDTGHVETIFDSLDAELSFQVLCSIKVHFNNGKKTHFVVRDGRD